MKHRISVGALVVEENKILLVNHKRDGRYDFWVAPGGGIQGIESLTEGVAREVREETGLIVDVGKLMYVEEMYNPEERSIKFWYLCELAGGNLDCTAEEATQEYIVDAKFMAAGEFGDRVVFPTMLLNGFWEKIEQADVTPEYLTLREMEFY